MLIRAGLVALILAGSFAGFAPTAQAQNNSASGGLMGGATGSRIDLPSNRQPPPADYVPGADNVPPADYVPGADGAPPADAAPGPGSTPLPAYAPQVYYMWGPDGQCYMQGANWETVPVYRRYCE
ncbi:hypothetical protein [Xanthobacter variabilis]|uniref:hypothetical protein n=1 Tax=Xanthobacter variabilis TaxID=3119932 RepID=UPI00374E3137